MNPYPFVRDATANGESLLSLCSGIGLELSGLATQEVTAADIAPQYLAEVKNRCPQTKTVESDALSYLKSQPDKSVDIISIIDGIEHMDKATGRKVVKEMQRVARKRILLFFPEGQAEDGYLRNEPHNAWGIEGADEHQTHKSGWRQDEFKKLGFRGILATDSISQHGEPYTAVMMDWQPDV